MNFFKMIFFMEPINCVTANWLVERPILYKSTMVYIVLHVANLEIATTTVISTGIVGRIFVSCFCNDGASVEHKYSNVEKFIRIRVLNSRELNDPRRFRSKNPGCPNPLSWAHRRINRLAYTRMEPSTAIVTKHIYCQCNKDITHTTFNKLFIVHNIEIWNINNIASLRTLLSILVQCE